MSYWSKGEKSCRLCFGLEVSKRTMQSLIFLFFIICFFYFNWFFLQSLIFNYKNVSTKKDQHIAFEFYIYFQWFFFLKKKILTRKVRKCSSKKKKKSVDVYGLWPFLSGFCWIYMSIINWKSRIRFWLFSNLLILTRKMKRKRKFVKGSKLYLHHQRWSFQLLDF